MSLCCCHSLYFIFFSEIHILTIQIGYECLLLSLPSLLFAFCNICMELELMVDNYIIMSLISLYLSFVVVASGVWVAPGDSEEVAAALSQSLRNYIER